jgi:lysophospholipase L1-like esterase
MPADARRRPAAVLIAVLVTLLLGCSGPSAGPSRAHAPRFTTYTALGDSFTAAPFVPTTSLASGCFRSSGNYPARLAHRLGARLRDVSCSAATTRDITHVQRFGADELRSRVAAQLRSVRRGTDLVTVGIGGNDEGLFGSLVRGCTVARSGPSGGPEVSCPGPLTLDAAHAAAVTRRTGMRVARVLQLVKRAAPSATVVLVGYPRLVEAHHGCSRLPLRPSDRPALARVERLLNRALARAAEASGARFLDLHPLSRGHEICSAHPWVNGRITDQQRAAAYHPFPVEQQAVADALADLLTAGDGG